MKPRTRPPSRGSSDHALRKARGRHQPTTNYLCVMRVRRALRQRLSCIMTREARQSGCDASTLTWVVGAAEVAVEHKRSLLQVAHVLDHKHFSYDGVDAGDVEDGGDVVALRIVRHDKRVEVRHRLRVAPGSSGFLRDGAPLNADLA